MLSSKLAHSHDSSRTSIIGYNILLCPSQGYSVLLSLPGPADTPAKLALKMKSLQALSGDHINISLKQAQVHYDSQLLHQSLILKDEESRRLRLRVALLEVANEELQDELSQGEEKVETLEHERLQLREQIHEQEEEVVHLHTDLKSKAREVEILKVRTCQSIEPRCY
jgi:predicted  nucleic acid-binding Zn-ribbon protein